MTSLPIGDSHQKMLVAAADGHYLIIYGSTQALAWFDSS